MLDEMFMLLMQWLALRLRGAWTWLWNQGNVNEVRIQQPHDQIQETEPPGLVYMEAMFLQEGIYAGVEVDLALHRRQRGLYAGQRVSLAHQRRRRRIQATRSVETQTPQAPTVHEPPNGTVVLPSSVTPQVEPALPDTTDDPGQDDSGIQSADTQESVQTPERVQAASSVPAEAAAAATTTTLLPPTTFDDGSTLRARPPRMRDRNPKDVLPSDSVG